MREPERDGRGREREPRRERSPLNVGRVLAKLILMIVVLAAVAAGVLVYLGKSDEGLMEDMASGLGVVAERLEQGDNEGAAEKLRQLQERMEGAGPASREYSAKVKDALSRIKDKSGEFYEKAKGLVKDKGDGADEAEGENPSDGP